MIQVVCMTLKPKKGAWEIPWGHLIVFYDQNIRPFILFIAMELKSFWSNGCQKIVFWYIPNFCIRIIRSYKAAFWLSTIPHTRGYPLLLQLEGSCIPLESSTECHKNRTILYHKTIINSRQCIKDIWHNRLWGDLQGLWRYLFVAFGSPIPYKYL